MRKNNKELFDRYIYPELDFIGRLCRKYCTDRSSFPDLYNELLTTLFLYIHTYDTSKCIRPWIYVVVRRRMYRLQTKDACSPVDFVDMEHIPYSCMPGCDIEKTYDDVYVAIEMLEPVHRDIVRLRLEGYKTEEIAAMMYARGCISADSRYIVKAKLRESYRELTGMLSMEGDLLGSHATVRRTKNKTEEKIMAKLKSEIEKWISMPDRDYLDLVEDHIMMTALRAAGIEDLPIYRSAKSILKNNRVEIHLKPVKPRYK